MMKLLKDKKHQNMYRLQWPDGTISISTPNPDKEDGHYGFYNLTWAKDHIKHRNIENYILDQTYDASISS